MYIVLITKGRYNEVHSVKINLFEKHEDAKNFCIQYVEKNGGDGYEYWTYAEIIEESKEYMPRRYKNL